MPVSRIEQIVGGAITRHAEPAARGPNRGNFVCLLDGRNKNPVMFASLDLAADFLRSNPGSGIRMRPGRSKIVDYIHIDGVAR